MDLIVREGLLRLATLYDREVLEPVEALWTESFAGIDSRLVEAALRHMEKTFIPTMACPFPTPAHVWEVLREAQELAKRDAAEARWQQAIANLSAYHPDLGWSKRCALDARTLRAVNAAGGIRYLWSASPADLVWAKKAFVETYLRDAQLETYADLLHPELQALLTAAVAKRP